MTESPRSRSHAATTHDLGFTDWARQWMRLAAFSGRRLPDEGARISAVIALWREPIPPGWTRGQDSRLLHPERRYGRGNYREDSVRRGEHAVEYDVLSPSPAEVTTICLGARLVDGVNALPLAKDAGGGRAGNVEADMLLLVRDEHGFRLQLIEVKATSNSAWYGAVENLRQLRLFLESREAQVVFHTRCPDLRLPETLPVTAVLLAPQQFYAAPGQKVESVAPTQLLLERMRAEFDVDVRLAIWEPDSRTIESV